MATAPPLLAPPHKGEGWGGGAWAGTQGPRFPLRVCPNPLACLSIGYRPSTAPTPNPSPQGGGEFPPPHLSEPGASLPPRGGGLGRGAWAGTQGPRFPPALMPTPIGLPLNWVPAPNRPPPLTPPHKGEGKRLLPLLSAPGASLPPRGGGLGRGACGPAQRRSTLTRSPGAKSGTLPALIPPHQPDLPIQADCGSVRPDSKGARDARTRDQSGHGRWLGAWPGAWGGRLWQPRPWRIRICGWIPGSR